MSERKNILRLALVLVLALALVGPIVGAAENPAPESKDDHHSVARQWNEELLHAIRNDLARPTVHARNLFHISAAMYDAWAAYDETAGTWLHHERAAAADVEAARAEAISFAAYRMLRWRFADSPGSVVSLPAFDDRMDALGYDSLDRGTEGDSPAALGNRIAETYIEFGLTDGANEENDYANLHYTPINPSLIPSLPGNPNIIDRNRWQPLALQFFVDQAGNVIPGGSPPFQSPEWGIVKPFALSEEDLTIYNRDGFDYWVYHDPGPPPMLGGANEDLYRSGFEQVVEWSGLLDPASGVMIDVSPASNGDNTLGTNDGNGYDLNPATGAPYAPQIVPEGDYYRILAEFWADGPDSETPPGHWFTIANYVSDHPEVSKQLGGDGPVLGDLEWDIKVYFALGGAMHDVAIAAWGAKGWYDYVRPISAIRAMADRGQSSDPDAPSYDPEGIGLIPGVIEVITDETAVPGGRHEHLGGVNGVHIGKIAVNAWRGPDYIEDPANEVAGVGWILAEDWWPYQRPSFVTPPFAGYVSGHSTYSRAAAEIMTLVTGDEFFPGGLGEFFAPANEFLVFEDGPSVDVTLQWAKYYDASDECSLSRIYGGIHPTADDIPGRLMGAEIGPDAYEHALLYFNGEAGGGVTVGTCQENDTTICLNEERFAVTLDWRSNTDSGQGRVVDVSSPDSGLFYFFGPNNWEVMIKVLNGCNLNSHYWVFAAATTDVEYTLTVTDTLADTSKSYFNPLGNAAAATTDTEAFATCP